MSLLTEKEGVGRLQFLKFKGWLRSVALHYNKLNIFGQWVFFADVTTEEKSANDSIMKVIFRCSPIPDLSLPHAL